MIIGHERVILHTYVRACVYVYNIHVCVCMYVCMCERVRGRKVKESFKEEQYTNCTIVHIGFTFSLITHPPLNTACCTVSINCIVYIHIYIICLYVTCLVYCIPHDLLLPIFLKSTQYFAE